VGGGGWRPVFGGGGAGGGSRPGGCWFAKPTGPRGGRGGVCIVLPGATPGRANSRSPGSGPSPGERGSLPFVSRNGGGPKGFRTDKALFGLGKSAHSAFFFWGGARPGEMGARRRARNGIQERNGRPQHGGVRGLTAIRQPRDQGKIPPRNVGQFTASRAQHAREKKQTLSMWGGFFFPPRLPGW